MKKSILGGLFVFAFTFIALFLALDGNHETYAKLDMDSRFRDFNFYTCVRDTVGETNILSDGVTIKTSALENLAELSCTKNTENIRDATGLSAMKNLKKLTLTVTKIESIDLTKNTKLWYLNLYGNKLKTINLNKNTELKKLDIYGNNLTTIDLSNNKKLVNLDLGHNNFSSINVKSNTNLEYLNLAENNLETIDLSKNTKLKSLSLVSNKFAVKPSKCEQLGSKCSFGYIVKFNTTGGNSVQSQNTWYLSIKPIPYRSGYTFKGWYKDSNLTTPQTFPEEIISNKMLYAKWQRAPLAQETEIVNIPNNNRYTMTVIAMVAFMIAICCELLSYSASYLNKIEAKVKKKK